MITPIYKKYPILYVIIGSVILAIGIAAFLDSAQLYSGGFTGLSQLVVNLAQKYDILDYKLNLGVINFILPLPVYILCWRKFSRKFVIYSFISLALQSAIIALYPILFPNANLLGDNILAKAIFGGILSGLGNGLVLKAGGSTGGALMLFQFINIKTSVPVGTMHLTLNCCVVLLASIFFDINIGIYTIISYILVSFVIDRVHTTYNYIRIEIITENGEEIIKQLLGKFTHGVTHLKGVGEFTKHDKNIVYTIVSDYELDRYVREIQAIDPKAFVCVYPVKKVVGNFKKKVIG